MIMSTEDRRARACAELRRGAPVMLTDPAGGAPSVILAAETARQDVLDSLAAEALTAPPVFSVSAARARALKARVYDDDLARLTPPDPMTAATLRRLADPAGDLDAPLRGPFAAERSGDPKPARAALLLCKRAKLLPAALVWTPLLAAEQSRLEAAEIIAVESVDAPPTTPWRRVASGRVPISGATDAQLHVFRRDGWEEEHYALEIGEPSRRAPVLTRLHSACVTGDLFGSLKCDCGPQLQAALARIVAEGAGVLVYLNQEGRGIGLANKMRAYRLQDQGYDTVEANHRLGFQDDERLLGDGVEILQALGFSSARVMTNNPAKLSAFEALDVAVAERLPLETPPTAENARYLETKARKSGHLLGSDADE